MKIARRDFTFGIGAVVCLLSLLAIRSYPITRGRLGRLRDGERTRPRVPFLVPPPETKPE